MTRVTWDGTGQRRFETGVDRGVLYEPDDTGEYVSGVPWNGLTTVTESPSGAESNKQYADNIVYLNLLSQEQFGATVEAFTYPEEFEKYDGSATPADGVYVGQQTRTAFGLSYRSLLGNDVVSTDLGYKLHVVYNASASPSEKARATVNDTPEAMGFSWELTTVPVPVTGLKPTAHIVIDSTKVDAGALSDLEDILYGTVSEDARLPLPDELIALFAGGAPTVVNMGTPANQPTYNAGTHVVTLPTVVGVQWKIGGVNKAPGAQPALSVGQIAEVRATPTTGHVLDGNENWTYDF